MKKHSCGAILYTVYNNNVYIILGMEQNEWFPFKGTKIKGETPEETAIREINEETCGIVKLDSINLDCHFATKRKYYHIGLTEVGVDFIKKFHESRRKLTKNITISFQQYAFLEKTDVKMFHVDDLQNLKFHEVTQTPIDYYYDILKKMQIKLKQDTKIGFREHIMSILSPIYRKIKPHEKKISV